MTKLAEEIWKTALFSLIIFGSMIGFFRYAEKDSWWLISDVLIKKDKDSPIIYYSIKNLEEATDLKVSLFVKNHIQEEKQQNFGVFENVFPGQSLSLRVSMGEKSIRTPSFILKNREIKNFSFLIEDEKLVYLGNNSRFKKIEPPVFANFSQEQDILKAMGVNLFEEVKAKETKIY